MSQPIAATRHRLPFIASLAIFAATAGGELSADNLDRLTLPPGFELQIYADHVPDARQLAVGPDGLVFVGSRNAGKVYALVDKDADYAADAVVVVAENLYMPSGVAYRDGDLYVAEVNRILRFPDIAQRFRDRPTPEVVYGDLPSEGHHGWKTLAFGPDDKLYVPVGAPCNICLKASPYASILRMAVDGSAPEVYASGIRNSVGLAWHPTSHELWFTDNGRDWLGDDLPSCELNRVTTAGQHFGFPYRHGAKGVDPKFGKQAPEGLEFTPPMVELGAHVAPLGLMFYRGKQFPDEYQHNLLIAEHGSWNRTQKSGYRVVRVVLDASGSKVLKHAPFITGWLQGDAAWGRPTDLAELPDGSVLIADDMANRVYRLHYRGSDAD